MIYGHISLWATVPTLVLESDAVDGDLVCVGVGQGVAMAFERVA